jgi:WD40 repeat protein
LDTGREDVLRGHAGLVEGLAFHPGGRLLATAAADDGTVRVWDRTAPDPVRTFGPGPFGTMARRLAFSPDGRYLATANFGGTVTILRTPE